MPFARYLMLQELPDIEYEVGCGALVGLQVSGSIAVSSRLAIGRPSDWEQTSLSAQLEQFGSSGRSNLKRGVKVVGGDVIVR